MADNADTRGPRHGRVRTGVVRRIALWIAIFAATVALVDAAFDNGRARLPDLARAKIEHLVNGTLARRMGGSVRIGGLALEIDGDWRTKILLENLELSDPTGATLANLNEVSARLLPGPLWRGDVVPTHMQLSGAQITIRRDVAGRFTLGFGGQDRAAVDLAGLIDAMDEALARPALAHLRRIDAGGLTITLEDARTGRLWQATNARMAVSRGASGLSVRIASEIFNGTEDLARIAMTMRTSAATSAADLGIRIEGWPADDIAAQSPALAMLGILDAPISGAVRTALDPDGALQTIAATLEIGAGALAPADGAPPVPFDAAHAYFDYDPARQRITFDEVAVDSPSLALLTEGHAYLEAETGQWPDSLVGQLRLRSGRVDERSMFDDTVHVIGGSADFRLALDPFEVTLGQARLVADGAEVGAKGRFAAGSDGWSVSVDAHADRIARDPLLALWPRTLAPGVRRWVDGHVSAGRITDFDAAIRLPAGGDLDVALDFDFADGRVTPIPTMPPLTGAAGRGTLTGRTFTLALDDGTMDAGAGPVDGRGTVFRVLDVDRKPTMAEISIAARGEVGAAMHLLDAKPVELADNTGLSPEGIAGTVAARADLTLPLVRDLKVGQVGIDVTAELIDVESETLVEGHRIEADRLALGLTADGVTIAGPVRFDGVPVEARLSRPLGKGTEDASVEIAADLPLSPATARALEIPLPDEMYSGEASGALALTLRPDAPPEFTLTSDLRGLSLRLPSAGFAKGAGTPGTLEVAGSLGAVPDIRRLALTAPGLSADGRLRADGERVTGLDFTRVRLGGWLDAPMRMTFRPGRDPAIEVTGGTVDIRDLPSGGGGGGSSSGPLSLALDRLVISDTIALSPFRAELENAGSGRFQARVNGGAPVSGALVPVAEGTAIRLAADDAGEVLKDAGLMRNVDDGRLSLLLRPTRRAGTYDGSLVVERTRLRNNPTAAALLDAISIVGILDQLEGPGILFETVDARFTLSPTEIRVRRGAAIGASIGVSMDGVYDFNAERMEMQGVISPIYIINSIGSIFTRRGEGLLGISYRMSGTAGAPTLRINPLSLLAPGMLREIFRRPTPAEGALSRGRTDLN